MAGLTALSVDTRMKRSTPTSPAAAATMRVATALLRTASTGFSSISGTCLYAAAWNTTDGECSSNTSRTRVASLQSASTADARAKCRSSSSSRCTSNSEFSEFSTSTSRFGPTRAIWRHSSAPIEPPAPVTSTTRPLRYAPTRSISTRTGSRPSTSSTRTSRTWRMRFIPPDSSSNVVGSVRTGMARSRHAVTTFWRSTPGAEGIAMITSSGFTPSSTRGSSSVVPSTLCPAIRMPCLRGSSST